MLDSILYRSRVARTRKRITLSFRKRTPAFVFVARRFSDVKKYNRMSSKIVLLTALICTLLLFGAVRVLGHSASDRQGSTVTVILASGCFWGRQHDIIEGFEIKRLNRGGSEVTTVGGYAGGNSTDDVSCYYNSKNASIYSTQGHAEAVSVEVPVKGLRGHAAALFDLYFLHFFVEFDKGVFVREDAFDLGSGYR